MRLYIFLYLKSKMQYEEGISFLFVSQYCTESSDYSLSSQPLSCSSVRLALSLPALILHLLRDAEREFVFILLCLHSFLLVNNAFSSRLHCCPMCKKALHENHACVWSQQSSVPPAFQAWSHWYSQLIPLKLNMQPLPPLFLPFLTCSNAGVLAVLSGLLWIIFYLPQR